MKRSKFTEEQIPYALRQHDAGTPVGDICRQLGASEASFYVWKKKYAHMGVSEPQGGRAGKRRRPNLPRGHARKRVGDLSLSCPAAHS